MALPATRYRHLAELAVDFLEAEGESRPAGLLAARLFAQPRAGPAAGMASPFVRLVEELLAGDERFVRDATGAWALRDWARASDTLSGTPFAVVGVETTGGRPERHRILEVAVVAVDGGEFTRQYASLVNPQRPLPGFVVARTGITQEMADEARPAEAVLPEVRAMVGDRVLVGHNVGSDLTFLNYEALWHDLPPFGNPALDTADLALRLLPRLRRPSLDRVAAAVGLAPPQRHRALAGARLTAAVLSELLGRVREVAGGDLSTVGQLQAWLRDGPADRRPRARPVTVQPPPGTLRSLPDAPGVYTFRDAAGEPLYVGKAASLQARVAQHFTGTARALRRHDGLLERTASVTHEVVACELDALLLESACIRTLQPPYNVQARSRQGCPLLRFESGPFPRAGAAPTTADEGRFAGPYRTTQQVRHTLSVLRRVFQIRSCRRSLPATRAKLRLPCLRHGQGLCPAPCAEAVTPEQYGLLVDYAWHFVADGREAVLEALDRRLARLEGSGAGGAGTEQWEYAVLAECRARLRRLRREYRPLAGGMAGGALVMSYPAAGEDAGAVLFFAREGRLTRRVLVAPEALQEDSLTRIVAEGLSAAPSADLDADQANILLRWIYRHIGRPECISAGEELSAGEVARAVLDTLGAPHAPVSTSSSRT
jgi:DNA polymerase-3 subunit epsilon